MSNAFAGIGAHFKASDMASSPVFTPIAEINDINGPTKSRDSIDVTSLDSTGGYKEFIGSFRDGGEVSLSMNFTHAGYAVINAHFEEDHVRDYQITLPNVEGTTFQFKAIVTNIDLKVPKNDKVSADCKLKISGKVTMSSVPSAP